MRIAERTILNVSMHSLLGGSLVADFDLRHTSTNPE